MNVRNFSINTRKIHWNLHYSSCFVLQRNKLKILPKMKVALIFLALCAVAHSTSINPEAQKQLVNIIPSLDPQTVDFLQTLLSTPEAVEYLKKDTNLQKQFEQALGVDSLFTDEANGDRCLLLLSWLTVLSKFVTVTASG